MPWTKLARARSRFAPPFRTLHLRYPVADLQRPLADGVHPIMPKFQLNAGQVEDVMAYLRMLRR
jgi:hypothetical protein